MEVIKLTSHLMDNNTYIVFTEGQTGAVVIDPSFDADRIVRVIEEEGLRCEMVLLTHGHFDHISGVAVLRQKYGAPVCIGKGDAQMLPDPQKNMSRGMMQEDISMAAAERELSDGEEVCAGGVTFRVLETPGHSPGGVCYIAEDAIFTGDTLFAGSIGRTDFPGGDFPALSASLEKLAALEGEYVVYPGHMDSSSLDHERENNPYMNAWPLL